MSEGISIVTLWVLSMKGNWIRLPFTSHFVDHGRNPGVFGRPSAVIWSNLCAIVVVVVWQASKQASKQANVHRVEPSLLLLQVVAISYPCRSNSHSFELTPLFWFLSFRFISLFLFVFAWLISTITTASSLGDRTTRNLTAIPNLWQTVNPFKQLLLGPLIAVPHQIILFCLQTNEQQYQKAKTANY